MSTTNASYDNPHSPPKDDDLNRPASSFDLAQMRQSMLERISDVTARLEEAEAAEAGAKARKRLLKAELEQLEKAYKATDPNYRKRSKS